MGQTLHVGIGQLALGRGDDEFHIFGLGSCVALFLWAPEHGLAGMAHILLAHPRVPEADSPGKYASTAVEALYARMTQEIPLDPQDLVAKMVGGAVMFTHIEHPTLLGIGEHTAATVRERLESLMIKLAAEDIGGHEGRSVRAFVQTGRVYIRTRSGEKWL